MSTATVTIGPYVVGEIPAPLEYQFLDSDGLPIDLTAYQARITICSPDGLPLTRNATVTDSAGGKVTYTWQGDEMPTAGWYTVFFWVGNGVNRFASVRLAFAAVLPCATAPAI